MSWMKYNKETRPIDLLPYISELSGFQAIVMDERTWNVICKRSASAAPGKAKGRKTKFLANLFELLNAQGETHPSWNTLMIMCCILSFPQISRIFRQWLCFIQIVMVNKTLTVKNPFILFEYLYNKHKTRIQI